MKKLALILLVAPSLVWGQRAIDMANPSTERKADAFLLSVLPAITDCQEDYVKTYRGSHWQGLISHTAAPADEAITKPDRLDNKPSDGRFTWTQFFDQCPRTKPVPPRDWPISVRVDVYGSRLGLGWTVTGLYSDKSKTYSRTIHVTGPEKWRDSGGWQEVPSAIDK